MKRIAVVSLWLAGFAAPASAVSLSVSPDATTYAIGETITLTVTGDSEGASDNAIRGQLQYDAALTAPGGTPTQTTHTSGGVNWTPVALVQIDGVSDAFNQTRGLTAAPVQQTQIAIVKLIAQAAGTVNVTWTTSGLAALDFFGMTTASGTSFTIAPEPGSATLITLGLAGIIWAGRRRRALD